MKTLISLIAFPIFVFCSELKIDPGHLKKIGLQVWQNECHGTLDGLITWNEGEEFPSLGIGHFIWHPNGRGKFEESFPSLIEFVTKKWEGTDKKIPSWLKKRCPWQNREEFLKAKRSKKIGQLRNFLHNTLDLQFLFLEERFLEAEQKLLPRLTQTERKIYNKLRETPEGIYALIDYTHFKGTGLSIQERYRNQGWGLLQVLNGIDPSEEPLKAFVASAKNILKQRIHNAPAYRKEERWKAGWFKRLETYLRTF